MRKTTARRTRAVPNLKPKTGAARRIAGGIIIICKPIAATGAPGDLRIVKRVDA